MKRSSALLLLVAVLLAPGAAVAQDQAPLDENTVLKVWPSEGEVGQKFRNTAGELRCPTCTGLSVLESDAKFSVQIKSIVEEQVKAGKSKDEILQYFTERYGPWILRSPPKTGFNLIAWLLPIGILLLGPPAVWFFVWRRRRVVSTLGVRPAEAIISEMEERLATLRGKRSAQSGG